MTKIRNSKPDDSVKKSEFVMPDLIRHPEYIEMTGFRLPPERQNMHILSFNETLKLVLEESK